MEFNARPPAHRIALISGGLEMGGATTFLINLAGELVRRGIAVEVFSFEKKNPLADDFSAQKIPVLCLDERRMIFEDRLAIILRRLREFAPTVVIANLGASSFEVLRYAPAGIFRIGVIHTDEASQYEMIRHYTNWMDLTAVVSQTMQQKAEAMPEFARTNVKKLLLGVPLCPDAELIERDFTTPLRLLYLGRLSREQKRVHLFPEIFRQLCASHAPFHWTIAGAGEEQNFLAANLKTVSREQTISFAGPVPYAAVPALLKQHDIFLLASDYEGLPLSLLEAMGHGLVPVVSNLKSGVSEVINQSNGCLVPVSETKGYAKAIIHLHKHRDELAAKSASARARVQNEFSVAAMTDRWLAAMASPPALPPAWPREEKTFPLVFAKNQILFSPAMRALRRAAAKFRR